MRKDKLKSTVIAEVSIVPIGTGSTSLSRFVSECVSILEQRKDVRYQLTPMGTIVEGSLDLVLEIIQSMHEIPFRKGISRVVTTIKIDDRRDKKASMQKKIDSVLKHKPGINTIKF